MPTTADDRERPQLSPPVRLAAGTLVSVVVPCFDEEAVIGEIHRRLVAALEAIPDLDFECVYVDDGSRDATLNILRQIHRADSRVRVLALSPQFRP